jgi:hypothetical protein
MMMIIMIIIMIMIMHHATLTSSEACKEGVIASRATAIIGLLSLFVAQ